MSVQLDLLRERAKERRDTGINRSTARAERVSSGWNDRAYALLLTYVASRVDGTFLTEQFVHWCRNLIEPPPDGRAWGGPIRRAALAGVVVRAGYAPANTSNCSPKCLWRRA